MVQMGVLVPTGDMIAVRRTAQFFLNRWATRTCVQPVCAKYVPSEARNVAYVILDFAIADDY